MDKKFYGFHLGYVVQNNDPDRGGKVKVYIPALMPTLASNSQEINTEDAQVEINFKDFSSLSPDVVAKLKNILPWARQLSPLIGSGTAAIFNANSNTSTTANNTFSRAGFLGSLLNGIVPTAQPGPGSSISQRVRTLISGGFGAPDTSAGIENFVGRGDNNASVAAGNSTFNNTANTNPTSVPSNTTSGGANPQSNLQSRRVNLPANNVPGSLNQANSLPAGQNNLPTSQPNLPQNNANILGQPVGLGQRITIYSPQTGGSLMEGGLPAARPGPDGKAIVRTLDDVANGRSSYLTLAGNDDFLGREYLIPQITFKDGSGNIRTLTNVRGVLHDRGDAFVGRPEGRFDIPVQIDVDDALMAENEGLINGQVQFIPLNGSTSVPTTTVNGVPGTPVTDPNNQNFVSSRPGGAGGGMFSIPGVGSVVWVFFENGEWELPVYFGYHHSTSAWREILGATEIGQRGVNVPNGFENGSGFLNGGAGLGSPIAGLPGGPAAGNIAAVADSFEGTAFAPGQSTQCANFVSECLVRAGAITTDKRSSLAHGLNNDGIGGFVPNSQLADGDVVFFEKTYNAAHNHPETHVGIFRTKNGVPGFIHRPTASKPVQWSPLSSGAYHTDKLLNGRRVGGTSFPSNIAPTSNQFAPVQGASQVTGQGTSTPTPTFSNPAQAAAGTDRLQTRVNKLLSQSVAEAAGPSSMEIAQANTGSFASDGVKTWNEIAADAGISTADLLRMNKGVYDGGGPIPLSDFADSSDAEIAAIFGEGTPRKGELVRIPTPSSSSTLLNSLSGLWVNEQTTIKTLGGHLTFIGSDHRQAVNLEHCDGGGISINNTGIREYSPMDFTRKIAGNSFDTYGGASHTVADSMTRTIKGDSLAMVGPQDYGIADQVKRGLMPLAVAKSNFPTQRTKGPDVTDPIAFISGVHLPLENPAGIAGNPGFAGVGDSVASKQFSGKYGILPSLPSGVKTVLSFAKTNVPTPEVMARLFTGAKGMADPASTPSLANVKRFIPALLSTNNGFGERPPVAKLGFAPLVKEFVWDNQENFVKQLIKRGFDPKDYGQAGQTFPPTRGTSPKEMAETMVKVNDNVNEILRKGGNGGDQTLCIAGNIALDCGLGNNTQPAVRVAPNGGTALAGVIQGDNAPSNIFKSTPLVEQTGNDANFPWGNITVRAGNGITLLGAAGGIKLKTIGVTEIAGVSTKISGKHAMELTSAGSMSIGAKGALSISADVLSLRQSQGKQLVLGGSAAVENNLTIGGAAIVGGELYCQHITGPAEIQVTEQTHEVKGWTNPKESVAYIPEGRTIGRLTPEICNAICILGGAASALDNVQGEPLKDKGWVEVPAYSEVEDFKLGVPPQYEYDAKSDYFYAKPKTGFADKKRTKPVLGDRPAHELTSNNALGRPFWDGTGGNAVGLPGTNKVGASTSEAHGHQFKNIALSLRESGADVIKEAGDVESVPDVRPEAKTSSHGKILVGKYPESKSAAQIVASLAQRAAEISNIV
jgi:hypothetical protein